MTVVRVPASTANLGPGFDALGMALSLHAEVGVLDDATPADDRLKAVDEHHPAAVAFARAGGSGRLWVRSPIPIGRGLGFSGAMRVGGAAAAAALHVGADVSAFAARRPEILAIAAELEGHADNAAASLYGGIVATDGTQAVGVATPLDPDVVAWVPAITTSTSESRAALPSAVAFDDAVFNLGRVAVLVAALAGGDVAALRTATADRLHQDRRLSSAPESGAALASGLAAGAWCGWLSGSGPTVVLLVDSGGGTALSAHLPPTGHTKVLVIDRAGAALVG